MSFANVWCYINQFTAGSVQDRRGGGFIRAVRICVSVPSIATCGVCDGGSGEYCMKYLSEGIEYVFAFRAVPSTKRL